MVTSAAVAPQTWAHPWARPAPARGRPDGWRRVVGSLNEPNAWTVGVVLATGVVLIARHPIARAIGTETPVRPLATAQAPARTHLVPHAPSLALSAVAVPTHAPRDPFRALITSAGKLLAPVEAPAVARTTSGKVVPMPTPVSASCAGASHRVVAGDTLWTLSARAVRSSDTARVTIAWHRLYAANRSAVGPNPSVLQVGSALCVPTSL
jgi:nucleoid-associated protein YgaU